MLPIQDFRDGNRVILRLHGAVAKIQYFLLNRIQAVRLDTRRRQRGPTVQFRDANHHVPTPEIVEIVRERAQRVQHVERVPARFELQPLPLHSLAVKKRIDGDGQLHDWITLPTISPNRASTLAAKSDSIS